MRIADFASPPLASLFALSLAVGAGCDSGPSCAVDTDCLLGEYCSGSGQCLALGTTGDGGGRDAGGAETGPRDAATDVRIDAPPTDAPIDAPMDDAPAPVCADLVGSYALTSSVGCLAVAMMAITGPAPSECAYEVALDGRGAGAIARVDDVSFSGMLSLVDGAPETCTFTLGTLRDTLDVVCASCSFQAARNDI